MTLISQDSSESTRQLECAKEGVEVHENDAKCTASLEDPTTQQEDQQRHLEQFTSSYNLITFTYIISFSLQ